MINEKTSKPYKDGDFVIKIGMVSDIDKRLGRHSNKLVKRELEIINFAAVNPYVTSDAETELKRKLAKIGQLIPGYKEIYVIDKKSIDEFRAITEKYPGDFNGLSRQVRDLQKANKKLRGKYDALKREVEVLEEKLEAQKRAHKKEVTSLKKELASLQEARERDLENANLRIENLQLQLALKAKRK